MCSVGEVGKEIFPMNGGGLSPDASETGPLPWYIPTQVIADCCWLLVTGMLYLGPMLSHTSEIQCHSNKVSFRTLGMRKPFN